MMSNIKVGKIVEGQITGVTKYGVFVSLEDNYVGMIHISEVSNKYIEDLNTLFKIGDLIKVKVLSIDEDKLQVKLSIKKIGNKNILRIVKRETEYFLPQIETKTMNEGWASFWHYTILKELDLPEGLHFEFLKRHNDVIAPAIGGINPYYIGFKI